MSAYDAYGADKHVRTLLSRWAGARARVWELTVSLRHVKVVLYREAGVNPPNLVLTARPVWMRGPFEWEDALLQVDVVRAAETPAGRFAEREWIHRLHDPIGFELYSDGDVGAAEHVKLFRD